MLLERLGRCGCGSFNKTQGMIERYTDSFTPAEVYTLRSVLLDRYGIESTRCAHVKDQYRIRIPKRMVVASTPTEGGGHPSAPGHSLNYSNG